MNSNHLKKFKNKALDLDEMRRRRNNNAVELRKNKREETLQKKRNCEISDVNLDHSNDTDPTIIEINSQFREFLHNYDKYNKTNKLRIISEIIQFAQNASFKNRLIAIKTVRKFLSSFKNPPIEEFLEAGIMPILINYLKDFSDPQLQCEVAWALTNIASGTSEQTNEVVKAGAVPIFIEFLSSSHEKLVDQTVWALGNIIGDGPRLRDYCINLGVVEPLVKLVQPTRSIFFLRNITWVIVNLCRIKDPTPSLEVIIEMLPALKYLIRLDDKNILVDTVWAINYLTDVGTKIIEIVINHGFVPHLVPLLNHSDSYVQNAALRTLGNIVTGTDEQTQAVLDCDVLSKLYALLNGKNAKIMKEVVWFISNITAGTPAQIQSVIISNLIPPVVDLLINGDFHIQREAAWAITNITMTGTPQQVKYLINCNIIQPMCNLLNAQDPQIIHVLLDGLFNILKTFPTEMTYAVEECGGLNKIEELQNHQNEKIYHLAYNIIEKFFSEDSNYSDLADKSSIDENKDSFNFIVDNNNKKNAEFNF